jgi:hypothetical protein
MFQIDGFGRAAPRLSGAPASTGRVLPEVCIVLATFVLWALLASFYFAMMSKPELRTARQDFARAPASRLESQAAPAPICRSFGKSGQQCRPAAPQG